MSGRSFIHEAHPARVIFGSGRLASLSEETARLGIARPLVIAPKRLSIPVAAAAQITDAVMHVPVEVAARAEKTAIDARADGVVAAGGGSSIGLAKAVALRTGLPIIAVPTTYSGSEMTSIWGLTEDGVKKTGRDPRVRPKTVIYDPLLLASLPSASAAASGMNAIAHAMEALYSKDVDPLTVLFAEEAVRALAASLPLGEDALYGAWLAGTCLDRATMGVHHKLCHVLGGTFNLDHARVHAVILPHAAAFNRDAAPEAMSRLAHALSASDGDAPRALLSLARRIGAPTTLASLGMSASDLDRAADLAVQSQYPNPRPVDRAGIRALLDRAFTGVIA